LKLDLANSMSELDKMMIKFKTTLSDDSTQQETINLGQTAKNDI
jgi:hypothetical protein